MSGTAQPTTASPTTTNHRPERGEIWLIDLSEPPRGREEGGKNRPALILSVDRFNQGPADLVIVVPTSARDKGIRSHIAFDPPEGGTRHRTFIKCEAIRSITKQRLIHRIGRINDNTLRSVEDCMKMLLGLY
jgi:mRNA interferase MazF